MTHHDQDCSLVLECMHDIYLHFSGAELHFPGCKCYAVNTRYFKLLKLPIMPIMGMLTMKPVAMAPPYLQKEK